MAFNILMVEDDRQICEVVGDFFAGKSGGELELSFAADGDRAMEMLYQIHQGQFFSRWRKEIVMMVIKKRSH